MFLYMGNSLAVYVFAQSGSGIVSISHFTPGWAPQKLINIACAKLLRYHAVPSVWLLLTPGKGKYGGHYEAMLTPEQMAMAIPEEQFCSEKMNL